VYMWKNYENRLAVDTVIAKISRLTFLAHPHGVFGRLTIRYI